VSGERRVVPGLSFIRSRRVVSWVLTAGLACLCGLALPGSASAQEPPVAAYPFDEGAGTVTEDILGNHDGTIEHATWAEGKYGIALQFHGEAESNCVTVPDSPELQLTENFTLEAWIRPEGSLFGDTILFKEFEELGGGASYAFTVGFGAKGKLEGTIIEGEETIQTVTSPAALSEYKWAHVAFSFDGEKERLYVNGELIASHAASIGAISSSGPLQIGCAKGWKSDYFWGKIDELRIYDRTLSEAEIKEDRDAAILTPPSADPVAAYPFDEGEGAVAGDFFGEHDGAVEGPTWAEGKYGTALQFQGWEESDCVTVPDSTELQLTENFTLEAWIRPEGSLFGDTILFKEFEAESGPTYVFSVGFGAKGKLEGTIIEGEETVQTVTSPKALAENTWAHVAFSFDGEKERLYVDGELVASHTASIGAIASSGPLEIGCAKGWESDYFWGKIDELRIYGRTLSEAEVKGDKAKDMSLPKIELTGVLTEGLKEGTTKYPLKVHATDGEVGRPGVGVKNITISVDGEVVDSVEQGCSEGSCSMDREWVFNTETYGFEAHEISVSVEDQRGNVASRQLALPVANGSIPACSLTETEAESPPDETQSLPGGGTVAIYHGFEGEEIRFPSAPSEFNPKAASEEELETYGFPAKPPVSESAALEAWEETVGEVKESAAVGGCMEASPSQRLFFSSQASISGSGGPLYNGINSGYVARDPSGPSNQWRGAFTTYHQPELTNICRGVNASLATWTGVGGLTEHDPFFQAGTNEPWKYSAKIKTSAFTEYFVNGHDYAHPKKNELPMHINLRIAPGDRIAAFAEWKPAKNVISMGVINNGTKKAPKHEIDAVEVAGAESKLYDGREIWFNAAERPTPSLQSFNPLTLTDAGLVSGKGWQGLSSLQHLHRQIMQAANTKEQLIGQIMATPGPIRSDGVSFTETWRHCHP
jgi:Concanavalin A-like lectin/glucanases superfamily